MRDISANVMRRQKTAECVTAEKTYTDQGFLVPFAEKQSPLYQRMTEKIKESQKAIYVFWGRCNLPQQEAELLYAGERFRKITSAPITHGKYQTAVRTIVERCLP